MDILELLDQLNIEYSVSEHKAVYTLEEAHEVWDQIGGEPCKNLFLVDKNKDYYLVSTNVGKADIKGLENALQTKRLHFAKAEALMELLGLEPGSVTPLGIINDKGNKVKVIIGNELVGNKVLIHPNRNTATLSMECDDLIKVIEHLDHEYMTMDIPEK